MTVSGKQLTVEAWRGRLEQIAAELRGLSGAVALQNRLELALSRLWRTMQVPPTLVRNAYEDIDEGELDRLADQRAGKLSSMEFMNWEPDFSSATRELVVQVAIEIRALDKALHECREPGRTDDPNTDFLAYGNEGVFILPRVAGSVPIGRRGQAFRRRGLHFHRILPTHSNDIAIRLCSPSVFGPGRDGSATALVSAVFPKVELDLEETAHAFVVRRLANEDELRIALGTQMGDLVSGPACMVAVWPELTISPGLLNDMRSALEASGLSDNPAKLGLVVAGSWHEARAGGYSNVATVLGSTGKPLLEIVKRERFQLRPGVIEDIEPGNELPVLIYGDILIAFGICKDFCERRHETPFSGLDVDLVVVPSFGSERTMEEHQIVAGELSVGYGTRAFVVQQLLPKADGEVWGVVLRPSQEPRQPLIAAVSQNILLERTSVSCTIS